MTIRRVGIAVAISIVSAVLVGLPAGAAPASAMPSPVTTTTTLAAPDGLAFYLPPNPLPPAKPGTLIWAQEIPAPDGARAWKTLSHSRSVSGQDVAVSGMVIAPDGPAPSAAKGGRPVVTWAHGTTGLADSCAPSRAAGALNGIPWLTDMLAAGYVVTATDYQGLGTPGVHPYLVGESEGRAVLDAARVARRLPTGAGKRVLVAGHSQGGHAALFAGEIAKRYAPDLTVLGVAAGSPVSDVDEFLQGAADLPLSAGFLVMGVAGYRAAYPQLDTAPILTPEAAARADIATFGCAGQVLAAFAGDRLDTVFASDPSQVEPWATLLHANSAGNRPSGAPVMVWQGDADVLTPNAMNLKYLQKACAHGSTVDYHVYPGADHNSVVGAARVDVLAFFAARLRGDPPGQQLLGELEPRELTESRKRFESGKLGENRRGPAAEVDDFVGGHREVAGDELPG